MPGIAAAAARGRGGAIRADVAAGLTVAVMGIPQALAYATMAGLPPAYGLVGAAVPAVVAALAGRTPWLSTGPTNGTSLLVLAALVPWLGPGGVLRPDMLHVLATLTLLAGAIRLAAALAGGAVVIRFLPESVLTGFLAGAGVLIATMQVDEALGLPPVRGTGLATEVQGIWLQLAGGARPVPAEVAVAAAVVVVLVVGRRLAPRAPWALLAVVGASAAVWTLGLDGPGGVALAGRRAGEIAGWPAVALPSLDPSLLGSLLAPAAAIVVIGTLELVSTLRAGGGRPDLRREVIAQGFANVAGAFSGALPTSGSLTRSALLRMEGASTRLAPLVAGAVVVPLLLFGGPLLARIPQAALAGVLFVVAFGMIDRAAISRAWRAAPEPRVLLLVTVVATLFVELPWSVFIGAGLALFIHLGRTSTPRVALLRPEGDRLVPVAPEEAPPAVVLEVSGDLHYAAVASFLADAEALVPARAGLVAVDLTHAHETRLAALRALEDLRIEVRRRGGLLVVCGVSEAFLSIVRRSGSDLSLTPARAEPGASARECLRAAGAAGPGAATGGAPAA
jgi:SulP family sulfate permease